jgi:hypothetical protein
MRWYSVWLTTYIRLRSKLRMSGALSPSRSHHGPMLGYRGFRKFWGQLDQLHMSTSEERPCTLEFVI